MTEYMRPVDDVVRNGRRGSLATVVREAIERCIAGGALQPGDKLNEADWAARLQVSRAPVREAFRALEQAGLVRMEKNRGVFVREVSEVEADELDAVRAMLEEAACRLLATSIDATGLAVLRDRLDELRLALESRDHEAVGRADLAFHDALVAMAGNLKLHETYRRVMSEASLFRRHVLPAAPVGTLEGLLGEYRALLTALASRDGERAAGLIRGRLNAGGKYGAGAVALGGLPQ